MPFIIGFDPAYRNLGVAIVDIDTGRCNMRNVDLATWGGSTHSLSQQDLGTLVFDYLRTLKELAETTMVGIEQQPGIGNRDVLAIQCHLESVIRCQHPSVTVVIVNPASVRRFWDTSAKTYASRKRKSMHTSMLAPTDIRGVRRAFQKRNKKSGKSEFHVDGVEAAQIALFVAASTSLTVTALGDHPRSFVTLVYECKVTAPEPKKRLKRDHILPDA